MRAGSTRKKMISDPCPPGDRCRGFVSFPVPDFQRIKRQMLTWASQVGICCFLDNHGYGTWARDAAIPETAISETATHLPTLSPTFECLLAVGAIDTLECPAGDAFNTLKAWAADRQEWPLLPYSHGCPKSSKCRLGKPMSAFVV